MDMSVILTSLFAYFTEVGSIIMPSGDNFCMLAKKAPRDELSDIEVNVPNFIFKLHLKRQFNVLHNVGS